MGYRISSDVLVKCSVIRFQVILLQKTYADVYTPVGMSVCPSVCCVGDVKCRVSRVYVTAEYVSRVLIFFGVCCVVVENGGRGLVSGSRVFCRGHSECWGEGILGISLRVCVCKGSEVECLKRERESGEFTELMKIIRGTNKRETRKKREVTGKESEKYEQKKCVEKVRGIECE